MAHSSRRRNRNETCAMRARGRQQEREEEKFGVDIGKEEWIESNFHLPDNTSLHSNIVRLILGLISIPYLCALNMHVGHKS